MEEFIFEEPERDVSWTPEDRDAEYQRQYNRWKAKMGIKDENSQNT